MIENTGQIRKALLALGKFVGATKERLFQEAIFIAGIKSSSWDTWEIAVLANIDPWCLFEHERMGVFCSRPSVT